MISRYRKKIIKSKRKTSRVNLSKSKLRHMFWAYKSSLEITEQNMLSSKHYTNPGLYGVLAFNDNIIAKVKIIKVINIYNKLYR